MKIKPMSNSEVTSGLRVVHLSNNLDSFAQLLKLKKQNRELIKANRAKVRSEIFPHTTEKILSAKEKIDNIISFNKVARNPHFLFVH